MIEPLHYRLLWKSNAVYPGAHPGQMVGGGQLFKRHEPLLASPDPRRVDLRASFLDPFKSYRVKVYQQQSTVDVYLLADLSASMNFSGSHDKKYSLVSVIRALANSARDYGDKFGFIGCADVIDQRFLLPASRHAGNIQGLVEQLTTRTNVGSAQGLKKAANYLSAKRSLVFLLSDFHFPLPDLQVILGSLQAHDVVPLVLWDETEYLKLPEWGLVTTKDLENNSTRLLVMRPTLKQKIITSYEQRQAALKNCCRAFGAEPLFLTSGYDPQAINRYFQQRAA